MKRGRKRNTAKLLDYYGGAPVARVGPHAVDSFPLATAQRGDRLWLDEAAGSLGLSCCDRLGLHPGAEIRVVSVRASGSVVFAIDGRKGQPVGVGAALAQQIWVNHQYRPAPTSGSTDPLATHLCETLAGSAVRVVGYEWIYRGYMGKLLSLGLAPGVEFSVRRLRSPGGAIEIELAGARLALGKTEARALLVEPVE